jgi:hypothetical protein
VLKTFLRRVTLTVLALGWPSNAPGPIHAQQNAVDFTTPTGQTLALQARPVLVYANGGAAAYVSAAVSLSKTQFRSLRLSGQLADTCQMSSEVSEYGRDGSAPAPPFAWTIASRLVSWSGTEATLDVRIERKDRTGAFRASANVETPRRLRLREGEHRVVDMMGVTGRDCDAVQFDVALLINDPAAVRHAALSYDIWLVHRDADGSDRNVRFRTSGLSGGEVPFAFPPLEHRTDGTAVRSGRGDLHTTIDGIIRGRARPDGRLELTVAASRLVSSGPLGTGDGGTKRLTVADGETVELQLPPFSGSLPGVDLAQFLASQTTAVRVTARRVR